MKKLYVFAIALSFFLLVAMWRKYIAVMRV